MSGSDLSNSNEVCLKWKKVLGQNLRSITGTFVNGTLHGKAKIVLENGGMVKIKTVKPKKNDHLRNPKFLAIVDKGNFME
jgi:hypothetical protein